MLDIASNDLTLGLVGSGLMGRGIAQIAAQAGVRVCLYDSRVEAAAEARAALLQTFAMLADKGKLSPAEAMAAGERIAVAEQLTELAGCQVVVEAIVENLTAKQTLFRQLEEIVADDCLLASNTSSLSITAIAATCRRPERLAGLHFFSPVPLMKIVEVIDGLLTAPWVGTALAELVRRFGHNPVHAQDTPGFIVNHAGRGYLTESLRIVGEGIADFAAIDRVLRAAGGFRMGPFELLDLTGLDVSLPVMESIYEQYFQEPRYRPSPILRQRLTGGLLGRKSGRGFYRYDASGNKLVIERPAAPALPEPLPLIWVSPRDAALQARVQALLRSRRACLDVGERPAPSSACLVLPLGKDATSTALAEGLDPRQTVALDPWSLDGEPTLMTTPLTLPAVRDTLWATLAAGGAPVTVIHDSPGFILQRVVAMIVNIGCDIAQQRIATPADIDCAVKLGLGYPHGPLALGDHFGAAKVLAVLDALFELYRDPRYRPSPWLLRRARLGVSLLTPEN